MFEENDSSSTIDGHTRLLMKSQIGKIYKERTSSQRARQLFSAGDGREVGEEAKKKASNR